MGSSHPVYVWLKMSSGHPKLTSAGEAFVGLACGSAVTDASAVYNDAGCNFQIYQHLTDAGLNIYLFAVEFVRAGK